MSCASEVMDERERTGRGGGARALAARWWRVLLRWGKAIAPWLTLLSGAVISALVQVWLASWVEGLVS